MTSENSPAIPVANPTSPAGSRAPLVAAVRGAALGLAVLYLALYILLACIRLRYPFELEWMEGGAVDHVRRVLAGRPLYVAPSLDFVPYIYAPLYFYVSAAVARITGVGFLPLRLVSFAASIGCFAVLFLMVRGQTGSRFAAALAVGLFAACYRAVGAWFDIARVDTLGLFLLLAAIYLLQGEWSPLPGFTAEGGCATCGCAACRAPTAAALVTLSFLTKQMALAMAAPLMVWSLIYQRRQGLAFVCAALGLSGVATVALNGISGGWYSYYVFKLPAQHELVRAAILGFWTRDLAWVLPLACASAIYFLAVQSRRRPRRQFWFWAAAAAGMVGGAWSSRMHPGGYDNVLMPAYAVIAALGAMGAHAALAAAQGKAKARLVEAGVYLLCVLQLGRLYYSPVRQLPTAQDRQAGERLVEMMMQIEGDVYLQSHGYLPSLAGKRMHAQWMAVYDVMRGTDDALRDRLTNELVDAVRQQRFAAIIADSNTWLPPDIETYYSLRVIPLDPGVEWPVTGMRTRPELLYLSRTRPGTPPGR